MKRFALTLLLLRALAAPAMTLTDHMVAQLVARTNGTSCAGFGQQNGGNGMATAPTLNTNYWLLGVTNITSEAAECISSGINPGGLTVISPLHCVFASHQTPPATNVWLLPNGTLYTNWYIAIAQYVSGSDIGIALMAKTNPFFCKIFPNDTNRIGAWQTGGSGTVPVFIRNHRSSGALWFYGYTNSPAMWFEPNFVSGSGSSIGNFTAQSQILFGDYLESANQNGGPASWPAGDTWISGDSGGAAYGIINNEAVLVGCAYAPESAPPISVYKAAVDATMANLSNSNAAPVYTTTLYDLSAFPYVNSNNVPPVVWYLPFK